MALGPQPLTPWPGVGAALAVLALALGTLAAVALRAEGAGELGPADWAALRFTVLQALVSAGVSTLLAAPVARALARRRFSGRGLLITLLGAPFLLPVLVAVLGLVAVFGQAGLFAGGFRALGLPPPDIYGAHGIVLAHVFLNLPLATRMILQGWASIPAERFRLAAQLDLPSGQVARVLEWPMLREVLPGAFLAIFLICLTSFAVALALGGGPRATTLELAIYQAVRFEFDLESASRLALVQLAIGVGAALLALRLTLPTGLGAGLGRATVRHDASSPLLRAQDTACILAAAAFLLLPLGAIVASGLPRVLSLPQSVWEAAGLSVALALASTALCIACALSLAALEPRVGRGSVEAIGALPLLASPLVMGTGLIVLALPFGDPTRWAVPATALVNALMALPFALRILLPAWRRAEEEHGRLAESLGMPPGARLRRVILPAIRAPLGFAAGLAAALSMGDLGVIALFAGPEVATLPLAMYRLIAAYRMGDAAGAALVLLALSLALFYAFDRGGRADA